MYNKKEWKAVNTETGNHHVDDVWMDIKCNNNLIGTCYKEDVERIVKCVNMHDELIGVCKLSLFHLNLKYKRETLLIAKLQQAINKSRNIC